MNMNLTLVIQALVFAAFIWITVKYVWPLIGTPIEERRKHIAEGLAAAEKGTRSLQDAAAKSEEQMKQARGQAQDILGAANKQAAQIVEQARTQAKTEGERIVKSARDEGDRQIQQAREQLRKQVGDLAVLGAARILKREVDAKAHADVIKELAAKI
jgi:F-type H+-transporting ATPase subunit b